MNGRRPWWSRRLLTTYTTSSRLSSLPRPTAPPSLSAFSAHLHSPAPTPWLLSQLVLPQADNEYGWPSVRQWSCAGAEAAQLSDETASGGGATATTITMSPLETLQGLRSTSGMEDRMVDVEIGRKGYGYLDTEGGWQQVRLPFGLFLDAFILRSIPTSHPDLIGYVAQQDLLTDVSALQEACPILPHTSCGPRAGREPWRRNLWVGPAGTFTPLHWDPYDNLFVQVVGTKRIHLFPPTAASSLYLAGQDGAHRQPNTSLIPTEESLLLPAPSRRGPEPFPLLDYACKAKGSAYTLVEPGDALFIPRGWLHCVQSLSTSVSVNTWWR